MDADLVGHVVPVEVVSKVGKPDGILRTQSVKVGKSDGVLRTQSAQSGPRSGKTGWSSGEGRKMY